MSIKTVLFDLDGTLLPIDPEAFVKEYFGGLCKRIAPRGYEPKELVNAIWKGTAAMVANDGKKTNEVVFWEVFSSIFGNRIYDDIPEFDKFYRNEFIDMRVLSNSNPNAAQTVKALKSAGKEVVVATNPIFPMIAQQTRIKKAGLDIADIKYITAYENSHYCKPNPEYYAEILRVIGRTPQECLMVGNDAVEDVAATELGIEVFILTDCLINTANVDINKYAHGGYDELNAWLKERI